MKWEIFGLVFLVLALVMFAYPVKSPHWNNYTLDSEHAKRFVDVTYTNNGPQVFYFNERGGGGLLFFSAKTDSNSFLNDLKYYFEGRTWVNGTVDASPNVGMFISAEGRHVSYQDATIGNEKLLYAGYDGSWESEVVDNVNNGINVGMYSSISLLNGMPVIFYHTEQGKKFGYAVKQNGQWAKRTLETGVGWMTSSDVCGNKVYVAYRGRDTRDIFLGVLDNNQWSSQNLGISTSSDLSLALKDCRPYLAYFDDTNEKVMFMDVIQNETYAIDSGELSRVSLEYNNGFHIAYHKHEKGLFYGYSKDGKQWETNLLAKGRRDGWYNDMEVSDNGNIYVGFLNYKELKFMEYNVSSIKTVKTVLTISSILLLLISIIFWIKGYKNKKIKKSKNKKIKK